MARFDWLRGPLILACLLPGHAALAQDGGNAYYNDRTKVLCLKAGTEFTCVPLPHDSVKPVFFDFNAPGKARGVAFYSRTYYRSLGQENSGVIVVWEGPHSSKLFPQRPDTGKDWLRGRVARPVLPQDGAFARIYSEVEARNRAEPGTRHCGGGDGLKMMESVLSGECYVACWGRSVIQRDALRGIAPARVVNLLAAQLRYKDGIALMRSESHTAIEIHDGSWYVADPTFGFAYVVDNGKRLDVKELIAAIARDRSGKRLLFAAVKNGKLHRVAGETFMQHNPSLTALYYTPDKTLDYGNDRPL